MSVIISIVFPVIHLDERYSTAVDVGAFSVTVAHHTGSPLTRPRSSEIPPTLIPLRRRPLNVFVNSVTKQ